tara:strand:+ start:4032 stop:5105 length:1074 start_codon:yes stop_codon:yes gene_type:complete
MFLIDKYCINNPWDVIYNKNIYLKLLKLNNLNSWLDYEVNLKNKFNNLPNILVYGNEGSGKNSLIKLFLKRLYGQNIQKLNVKYTINGYGSNNIEVEISQSLYHIEIIPTNTGLDKYLVQEVIKKYAQKNMLSFNSKIPFKIIWIKNIDNLSYYGQTALRCIMEKYCKICKFILSGKQITKVIDPLISRCLILRMALPNNTDIMKMLMNISVNENKFLSIDEYSDIVLNCNNNIKVAITNLELKYHGIDNNESWKDKIKIIIKLMQKILVKDIKQSTINEIRDILYKIFITNINGTQIIKELLYQILTNLKDYSLSHEIIDICIHYENSLANGKRSIIHLEAFIFNIIDLLYKKYNI